jgi:hypothetical protein
MEEQQLERAKERKKKEAEGREVPKRELSKLEKETLVQMDTKEPEGSIPEKKRGALKPESSLPRFKSADYKNVGYINPITFIPPFTRLNKEGTLEIPRPKNKEVVMKLSDEIETRKRIEPLKSKFEFNKVNEEKSEREKISIKAVEAIFDPKAEGTTERNILKVHTKEFISEVKFEKRRLKIPKTVENGEKIIEDLKSRRVTFVGASAEEKAPEEELEIPNFIEFLLGKGAGKIFEGKPVCIIVEETKEKYEELISILCRDIFREKIGGKPTPIYRETIEELRHEFEPRVGGERVVVEKIEKSSKYLSQVLKGFFSVPNMGFLILVSKQPLKLADDIRKEVQPESIIVINPPAEIESVKDELLKFVKGKELPVPVRSFGEEFKRSVDVFDDELIKRYLDDKGAPWELKQDRDRLIASSSDGEKKASPIHSAMKAFVWMYEWKKHEKRIIPELEKEEVNRIVDVKIEDRNYEIETLFGVGDVEGELVKKIKNYTKGEKVYFVLRNVDIIRNFSLFSSFKKDWRKAGYKVEFFGIDLDKQELIPLDEFKNKLSLTKWD